MAGAIARESIDHWRDRITGATGSLAGHAGGFVVWYVCEAVT